MVHRAVTHGSHLSLSFRTGVYHSNTRIYVRLLGPCFKTGRLEPLRLLPSLAAVLCLAACYSRRSLVPTEASTNHSRGYSPGLQTQADLYTGEVHLTNVRTPVAQAF